MGMDGSKGTATIYVSVDFSFSHLRAWVRSISSALWAEVPGPKAWASIISVKVTIEGPTYLVSSVMKLFLSV